MAISLHRVDAVEAISHRGGFRRASSPALMIPRGLAIDDAGYEIVGICLHPRIAMDVFLFERGDPRTMNPCPCFRGKEG
jgi:hypothetical protein